MILISSNTGATLHSSIEKGYSSTNINCDEKLLKCDKDEKSFETEVFPCLNLFTVSRKLVLLIFVA